MERVHRVRAGEHSGGAVQRLVKGYEYSKGQFVVISKDDFKTAALEKTRTIDIIDFVDPDEIDERYFETPYYLQAGKGAARSYALLREAQHLAAVEAIGDALVLTMMRFADELADLEDFKFPRKADIRPAELKMARQLIDNLAADWQPDKYTDEYKENLMRVINAKMKGKKPRLVGDDHTPKQADVVDLMARLRASLEGKKAGSSQKTAASKGKKPARGPRRVA